jgi:hypothetical protein
MKTYVIQLENHDDVISVRDKLSWSKARRILLVWPKRGRVLDRRVDLLLLQRHCQELGAQLAFVTQSGDVITHAHDLSIPVFSSPAQAQQKNWHVQKRQRLNGRTLAMARTPANPVLLREQLNQLHEKEPEKDWRRLAWFCAGVFAFLALVLFFMPAAQVTLFPARKSQQITLPVLLQPGISSASVSGVLPALPITAIVEGRDQVESTSTILAPDKTAKGEVVFTNLTEQAVEIPENSIVMTAGAQLVRFRTTRPVRVAEGAGTTQTAPIEALYPGRSGNTPAGAIRAVEGDLGLLVSVENPAALKGGSDRSSPAPSQQDYETLKEKMLLASQNAALEEMHSMLEPGQRLVEESIRVSQVISENREPPENSPADWLQLGMQAQFEAWIVREGDLSAVAASALDATMPAGYRAVPGTLSFDYSASQPDAEEGAGIPGQLSAVRQIMPDYSPSAVVQLLPGRSLKDAQRMLADLIEMDRDPQIEISPSWWRRLPFLPFRIRLVEQ